MVIQVPLGLVLTSSSALIFFARYCMFFNPLPLLVTESNPLPLSKIFILIRDSPSAKSSGYADNCILFALECLTPLIQQESTVNE